MQQSGGGGEQGKGLSRFRSAPATWLEALLESEEEDDPPKSTHEQQCLSQLPSTSTGGFSTARNSGSGYMSSADAELFDAESGLGFHRQNSCPPEFLAQISSGSDASYFSNLGIELPPNYDYLPSSIHASPSSKRPRDVDSEHPASKLKTEQSGQMQLLDMDMDKLLEDSVPCRVRAKRGCATHPRSIAERVRRTRISDRLRKLQELVPNMDKNDVIVEQASLDQIIFAVNAWTEYLQSSKHEHSIFLLGICVHKLKIPMSLYPKTRVLPHKYMCFYI
ncbi:hypothetical protein NMG60_11025642 [Bertholletia excelsa]